MVACESDLWNFPIFLTIKFQAGAGLKLLEVTGLELSNKSRWRTRQALR